MASPEVPWAPCPCPWPRRAPRGRRRPRSRAAPARPAPRCAGPCRATRSCTWTPTIWWASPRGGTPEAGPEVLGGEEGKGKACLPCAPNSWTRASRAPRGCTKAGVGTTSPTRSRPWTAGGAGGCPAQETSALNPYLTNLTRPSTGLCLSVFLKVRGLTPNPWTTST